MKPEAHGGDLLRMAATAGRDPASLLDFSVNVRPEGPPEFIRAANMMPPIEQRIPIIT